MKFQCVVSVFALSVFSAHAKDGHWNPKTSTVVTAAPSAGTASAPAKTYYSYKSPGTSTTWGGGAAPKTFYSYKNPATPGTRAPANVGNYARNGAATIDSYKSSSKYPKISTGNWSASSSLSSAQSTATSKITSLQNNPAVGAATQAAIQSALHQ